MNVSIGNSLLVSLIAAILVWAGLYGTGTTLLTAPNGDHYRSVVLTSTAPGTQLMGNRIATAQADVGPSANETPLWRSDIMDSYESVPSLAALTQQGDARSQLAPDAAERLALLRSSSNP